MAQVNNVNGVQGAGGVSLSDPNLIQELQSLLYRTYDQCTSFQQVQDITAAITNALAAAGLPTNGSLMGFVNSVAAKANQQLINGGTVSVDNTATLSDANLNSEMATLLGQTFGACRGQNQVWAVVGSISSDLAAAGLPVSGPLMDYVQALAQQTASGLPPTPPRPPPRPAVDANGNPVDPNSIDPNTIADNAGLSMNWN